MPEKQKFPFSGMCLCSDLITLQVSPVHPNCLTDWQVMPDGIEAVQ